MIYKKYLTVPLYDNNKLGIIITDDPEELFKATNIQWDHGEILGAVVNACDKNKKRTVFIVLNPNCDDFKLSVITHEAVHAANRILYNVGFILDPMNDEPQAYLTDWIFDQVMNFLEKCKDECNKKTD